MGYVSGGNSFTNNSNSAYYDNSQGKVYIQNLDSSFVTDITGTITICFGVCAQSQAGGDSPWEEESTYECTYNPHTIPDGPITGMVGLPYGTGIKLSGTHQGIEWWDGDTREAGIYYNAYGLTLEVNSCNGNWGQSTDALQIHKYTHPDSHTRGCNGHSGSAITLGNCVDFTLGHGATFTHSANVAY